MSNVDTEDYETCAVIAEKALELMKALKESNAMTRRSNVEKETAVTIKMLKRVAKNYRKYQAYEVDLNND